MSASQIPNLLTSRGGPRSRGRGRGRGDPSTISASARRDQNIQATDTDAAVSRLSAVSIGYLDDPFAHYFVNSSGTRRLPIINRGTYTRTTALDTLISAFLSPSDPSSPTQIKQIVSLGAGTDTRYFRLRARNQHRNLLYHEFDFSTVCQTKRQIVERNKPIFIGDEVVFEQQNDSQTNISGEEAHAEWGLMRSIGGEYQKRYYCHPIDLRQLPSLPSLESCRGLRHDVPTLIISECCLCYLDVDTARDIVKWFGDKIPDLGIVLYEPIGVGDAFGQMMVENLAARGIAMPTVQRYKTLSDQTERLADFGFKANGGKGGSNAETIDNIWKKWISDNERERVDGLEGLDEVEEWQMLARHYAVVWGWKEGNAWDGWRRHPVE